MPDSNERRTFIERLVDCLINLAVQPRAVHVLFGVFAVLLAFALVVLALKV